MTKRFWLFLTIFIVALTFGLILFVPAVSPKIDETTIGRSITYDPNWERAYCKVELRPATKYRIESCTFKAMLYDRNGNLVDKRELRTNSSITWIVEDVTTGPERIDVEIIRVKTNNTFDLILSILLICGAGVSLWLAIQIKRRERKEIEEAWREKYKKESEQ